MSRDAFRHPGSPGLGDAPPAFSGTGTQSLLEPATGRRSGIRIADPLPVLGSVQSDRADPQVADEGTGEREHVR